MFAVVVVFSWQRPPVRKTPNYVSRHRRERRGRIDYAAFLRDKYHLRSAETQPTYTFDACLHA